jgi:periplasmic copper chaperone A
MKEEILSNDLENSAMYLIRVLALMIAIIPASLTWSQSHSADEISVMHAWSRTVPIAGMNAVGYMTIVNNSNTTVTLKTFETDAAQKTSLHETVKEGDMVSMKALPAGIRIPANGKIELTPGGIHLMLIKIKQPLTEGDRVPLTLIFDSGKKLSTELLVKGVDDMDDMGKHSKMHH